MDVKTQLEGIRGRPIMLKPKFEDIPCHEMSDSRFLCKNPAVSVRMTTYNHEPFIRQAVESVMMQETDFEYELIIGEDASTDMTRDICFELQRKYPDRIRVLWSEENVYKMGGNFRRVEGRCRGEYLAYLEGDDYWEDPHRLQKQVDAMRKHTNVVLCFGEQNNLDQKTGRIVYNGAFARRWSNDGLIEGSRFAMSDCLVPPFTSLIRASAMQEAKRQFDVFDWSLVIGDLQIPRALCNFGDFYFFREIFATYRDHEGGVTKRIPTKVQIDAGIIRMYFAVRSNVSLMDSFLVGMRIVIRARMLDVAVMKGARSRNVAIGDILSNNLSRLATEQFVGVIGVALARLGAKKAMSSYFKVSDKIVRVLI